MRWKLSAVELAHLLKYMQYNITIFKKNPSHFSLIFYYCYQLQTAQLSKTRWWLTRFAVSLGWTRSRRKISSYKYCVSKSLSAAKERWKGGKRITARTAASRYRAVHHSTRPSLFYPFCVWEVFTALFRQLYSCDFIFMVSFSGFNGCSQTLWLISLYRLFIGLEV